MSDRQYDQHTGKTNNNMRGTLQYITTEQTQKVDSEMIRSVYTVRIYAEKQDHFTDGLY
jgi:hypothetical protein